MTILFVFLQLMVAFCAAASMDTFDTLTNDFIDQINSAQNLWTAGHNFPVGTKIADLKVLTGTIRKKPPVIEAMNLEHVKIPKSFDSRTNWPDCKSIKEIKNQGHCGSCWAVSSATTMSDRLCISTKGKFNTDISAQNIVSCSEDDGCNGGWPFSAWEYFIKTGVPTGGDYDSNEGCQPYLVEPCINRTAINGQPKKCPSTPYVPTPKCHDKCYNKKYHKSMKKDVHKAISVKGVQQDVKQIQANIMKYGPVVADFTVYADFLTYKSGVYKHVSGGGVGGHAIRIIGWGVENGQDYWLITNQWGVEWGEKGLVKFIRGVNECGIEEDVVSGITGSG